MGLVFGPLIVLTSESGAVLAWAIHVIFETNARSGDQRSWRRLLAITAGWLLVFAGGLALLWAMQRHLPSGRMARTLGNVMKSLRDGSAPRMFFREGSDLTVLLLAGAVVHLAGVPVRRAWVACACALPLFLLAVVSSYAYPVDPTVFGPVWPARMVMFWSLLIAECLFAVRYAKPAAEVRAPSAALWLVLPLAIIAQVIALRMVLRYNVFVRFTPFFPHRHFVSDALTQREDAFLRCLSRSIPRGTSVALNGSLFGRFHRHDVVCPFLVENAWKAPQLIVCDETGRLPFEYGCVALGKASSLQPLYLDGLSAHFAPALGGAVAGCAQGRADQ